MCYFQYQWFVLRRWYIFTLFDSLIKPVTFISIGSLTIYVAIHSGGSLYQFGAFGRIDSLLIIDISRCMVHLLHLLLFLAMIHFIDLLLSSLLVCFAPTPPIYI